LQHPNIVQIYEVGEFAGKPFFSLEYVDGATLAQKIRDKPMPSLERPNSVSSWRSPWSTPTAAASSIAI